MKISGLRSGDIVGSITGRNPGEYLDLLPVLSLILSGSLQWPNSTADQRSVDTVHTSHISGVENSVQNDGELAWRSK